MAGSEASTSRSIPGGVMSSLHTPRSSSRPSAPGTPRTTQQSALSIPPSPRFNSGGSRRQSPAAALQLAGSPATGRPPSAAARALLGTSSSSSPSHAADPAVSTERRQRVLRHVLVVIRLALVGVGGVALWPTLTSYQLLQDRFGRKAAGAEGFLMVLLVAILLNILTELIWIVVTLAPRLHNAAYAAGWSCGARRYTMIIISEFVWAGFWLAMLLAMVLMKSTWWLSILASVLGITLSAAAVGLTMWLRVLTDREEEAEQEVARVTVAIQAAQQSGKSGSASAAGYRYLMQAGSPRQGKGAAPPAANMV